MREYGPDRVIGDVRFELSRESNSIHRYRVPFHTREKPTSNSTTTEGELNQPNPNVANVMAPSLCPHGLGEAKMEVHVSI